MSRGKKFATVAAVLVALIVAWDVHYVIDESEQGVLTNFGKIVPPVREPGLHFKLPTPIGVVYKLDRRVRPLMNLKQELITEDQKNVLVDGYLLWRVSDPIRYVEAIVRRGKARLPCGCEPRPTIVAFGW